MYGVRDVRQGPGSLEAFDDKRRCWSDHSETVRSGSGASARAAMLRTNWRALLNPFGSVSGKPAGAFIENGPKFLGEDFDHARRVGLGG